MDKQYDFKTLEPKMLELWEKSKAFAAPAPDEAIKAGMKPFTIIMPPPMPMIPYILATPCL
jgi:valyl-tRNA synthetase